MRVLHAIHDFLPRHRAGSEIYAAHLAREQSRTHHVTILAAEYEPARAHGSLDWRTWQGLAVVELTNNWAFDGFADTYGSPALAVTLDHVLRATLPDVLHVHNLLNLSLDLPRLARARGIPTVATLHDFTLVCPSGGQRVHLAEQHVCETIDVARCARCFPQSPFHAQMAFAGLAGPARVLGPVARLGGALRQRLPRVTRRLEAAASRVAAPALRPADVRARLAKAREVFETIALFVAPSAALAADFRRFGLPADKLRVSDYGFPPLAGRPPAAENGRATGPLRIGFVGTLVWHKGVHVLIDAARALPAGAFEVLLFGDPRTFPDYTATLRERAAGLAVRFMGAFDEASARESYAAMDVLVVPSLWPENSPLVIHEAFMAGVPVVGARTGGIPALVTDGVNGLLYDAASAPDLAGALRALLEDRARLRRFAAAAPAVKTIEQDAREWDAIYREVTG